MNRRRFIQSLSVLPAAVWPQAARRDRRRLLVIEGNSLSSMGNEATVWPQHLAVQPWMRQMRFGVVNCALGGATIAHIARRAQMVDSLAGVAEENWLLVFELTNTLRQNLGDVQATYDQHRAYCQARRALGFRVLIGTGISRNQELFYGTPTNFTHAQMTQLNDLIRDTYREFADGVVDFAAVPELGREDAPLNTTYFWDGVHLTGAGYALVLQTLLAELQRRVQVYYLPVAAA